jgi:Family of unknown function (DUF6141)
MTQLSSDNSRGDGVYFRETQQFRQPWLWALLVSLALLEVGIFGSAMVRQLVFRRPWGDRPMSNEGLMLLGSLMILMAVALPILFYKMALVVEARDDGLHCSFFPFVRRTIAFKDIERCEARSYNPLTEYGGWGIRFGRGGKAYNVSGNRGVQLELSGGERLLLGSQRPVELAAAIKARTK